MDILGINNQGLMLFCRYGVVSDTPGTLYLCTTRLVFDTQEVRIILRWVQACNTVACPLKSQISAA